jgi:hypothetical protein
LEFLTSGRSSLRQHYAVKIPEVETPVTHYGHETQQDPKITSIKTHLKTENKSEYRK